MQPSRRPDRPDRPDRADARRRPDWRADRPAPAVPVWADDEYDEADPAPVNEAPAPRRALRASIDVDTLSTGAMRALERLETNTSKTRFTDIVAVLSEILDDWSVEDLDALPVADLLRLLGDAQAALTNAVPKTSAPRSSSPSRATGGARRRGRKR